MGLAPEGNSALIKLCMSVGLLKVKVGLVLRVTNTLFEFMVALPDWYRFARLIIPEDPPLLGAGVGAGVGVGVGVGGGVGWTFDAQTEGWPEQLQLFWT